MEHLVSHKLHLRRVRGRRDRGFTLVEMLLATALCSVLLAALWMLMSTFGELFDKGQQQVERAQLCRALLEQMAEDLRSAIQDPLPGTAREASGTGQRQVELKAEVALTRSRFRQQPMTRSRAAEESPGIGRPSPAGVADPRLGQVFGVGDEGDPGGWRGRSR